MFHSVPTVDVMSTLRHPESGSAAVTGTGIAGAGTGIAGARRERILSAPLALVFASSFATLTSFYLLLSVTPVIAAGAGAGSAVAGLVTGVLLLGTVAAEPAAPALMKRFRYRTLLVAGAALMGLPALALLAGDRLAIIVAVSLVRGFGFGLGTVEGALTAMLLPPERRGEGLGLYGVVDSLPGVVALPSGLWLAGHYGYAAVVLMAAGTALVSFLPLAAGAAGNVAAIGLLAQALTATVGRWWAGRHGDRHGNAGLLVPGLAIAACGMAAMAWPTSPADVVAGMCLFGAGFGIVQNATIVLMLDRMPPSGIGAANSAWNLAYDAGYGAGPAAFGLFAGRIGYPAAFMLTSLVILAALPAGLRERSRPRSR